MKTWMSTVRGGKSAATAAFGSQLESKQDGRLIATDTGAGSSPGAGPGSTMRHGASLRSIMGVGYSSPDAGAGCLVLLACVLATRLRSSPGLVEVAWVWVWAGSHWATVSLISRTTA